MSTENTVYSIFSVGSMVSFVVKDTSTGFHNNNTFKILIRHLKTPFFIVLTSLANEDIVYTENRNSLPLSMTNRYV